jgi:hypothetical protein
MFAQLGVPKTSILYQSTKEIQRRYIIIPQLRATKATRAQLTMTNTLRFITRAGKPLEVYGPQFSPPHDHGHQPQIKVEHYQTASTGTTYRMYFHHTHAHPHIPTSVVSNTPCIHTFGHPLDRVCASAYNRARGTVESPSSHPQYQAALYKA